MENQNIEKENQKQFGVGVIIIAIVISFIIGYGMGSSSKTSESQQQNNTPSTESNKTGNTFNQSSNNQSSKEYAVMGRELWSAFACASWASITGDEKEGNRLFFFGYEQGKKFLGALNAGKITQEDMENEVPIGVTMLLQGPSEDFILGGISQTAQDDALEEVFATDGNYNSELMQKTIAGNKFRDGNCSLVGK